MQRSVFANIDATVDLGTTVIFSIAAAPDADFVHELVDYRIDGEPIVPQEISITRMAATSEAEKKQRAEGSEEGNDRTDKRTMGRKHIVPYGLYRAHGFVSAKLADRNPAAAYLIYARRLPRGRGYTIVLRDLPEALPGERPTRRLNRALEELVRECPGQYLWSYNRYKIPAGAPPP